jgi:hypothetical protein
MESARPRYPDVAAAKGCYESWYLKAGDAAGRTAVWLRFTVHKRPDEQPVGSLWITLFDGQGPHAAKHTPPPDSLAPGEDGRWLRIGEAAIGPAGASGEVPGLASWELRFEGGEAPFLYLPSGWMYRAPLPRTKALSLIPAVRVSGTVTVRGRTATLDGWPGMVGHNWGAEHAERWIWLHGAAFDERPDAWIDVVFGRILVGGRLTPWIANGCLSLDGRRHRLGGIGKVRSTRVEEQPARATFSLTGADVAVRGSVGAPPRDVVGWVYSDPDGAEHHTAHCAIADMRLSVERRGLEPLELGVQGGATYELGMREQDHGIAIQPFTDP